MPIFGREDKEDVISLRRNNIERRGVRQREENIEEGARAKDRKFE